MANPVTNDRLHFEDLELGQIFALGPRTVTREEMIAYAREYDPFPFHVDEAAAKASLLGGLAASGWQTGALSQALLVEAFLGRAAGMGGLGFRDLKWRKPFMAGRTLSGTAAIAGLRLSQTKPDRGIVEIGFDMQDETGARLLTMTLINMIAVREPAQ
jgi:acyl dehydratase